MSPAVYFVALLLAPSLEELLPDLPPEPEPDFPVVAEPFEPEPLPLLPPLPEAPPVDGLFELDEESVFLEWEQPVARTSANAAAVKGEQSCLHMRVSWQAGTLRA
jgi:hypothetical protein